MASNDNLHKRKGESHNSSRASMREKLVDKKKANEEHESNFNAGRVNVRERHLHRTGIRGRKICIFLAVLYILGLVCLVNVIILSIMYSRLHITPDGMDSLSFFESGLLRWMQTSDLETVTLYKHNVGGFKGQNLNLESQERKVILHGGPTTASPQMHVSNTGKGVFKAKKGFSFVDPYAEKEVITFDGSQVLFLPQYVKGHDIGMNRIISHRIVSDDNDALTFETNKTVDIEGYEGILLDGKTLTFDVRDNINISSITTKRMEFDAKQMEFKQSNNNIPLDLQFKLCVCRTTFQLYAVPQNIKDSSCKTVENIC